MELHKERLTHSTNYKRPTSLIYDSERKTARNRNAAKTEKEDERQDEITISLHTPSTMHNACHSARRTRPGRRTCPKRTIPRSCPPSRSRKASKDQRTHQASSNEAGPERDSGKKHQRSNFSRFTFSCSVLGSAPCGPTGLARFVRQRPFDQPCRVH